MSVSSTALTKSMLGVATNPSAMRPARRAPAAPCWSRPRWEGSPVGAGRDVQVFQLVILAVEGEGFSAEKEFTPWP